MARSSRSIMHRGLVERLAHILGNRRRLEARRVLGMRAGPDADFHPFDRALAGIGDLVADLEGLVAPFRDRALDHDLVAEAAGRDEPALRLDDRQPRHAVLLL